MKYIVEKQKTLVYITDISHLFFQIMSSCSFLLPKTYSTRMILGMVTGGRFLRSLPISRALINILCACAWSPPRVARGTDMLISRENSRARDSHWGLIPFWIALALTLTRLYIEEAAALAYEHANQVAQRQGCIFRLTCSHPELAEDHVLTSAYVKVFRTVTRNAVNKSVWRKKRLFLTSLKQTCNEYLIKFSENQSAPKLENRKTSPCSPCAPNLLHVLLSRIVG